MAREIAQATSRDLDFAFRKKGEPKNEKPTHTWYSIRSEDETN